MELKRWLSVWTLGSLTVLVGAWTFYFYRKYGDSERGPESLRGTQDIMVGSSVAYALLVLPVLLYYKCLDAPDDVDRACAKTREYRRQISEQGQKGEEGYSNSLIAVMHSWDPLWTLQPWSLVGYIVASFELQVDSDVYLAPKYLW